MKIVDDQVKALRGDGRIVAASLLSAWKSGLAFLGLTIVAFLYRHDASTIVAAGKLGVSLIGLATWLTNAYFVRKHWELEK